jgi:amino-acid N-acetyltransferase
VGVINGTFAEPFLFDDELGPSEVTVPEGLNLESVEFVSAADVKSQLQEERADSEEEGKSCYPFVRMLRQSARYIADHSQQTAVFYIPGDYVERPEFSKLMGDIALSWVLGLKIVLVVGCRFDVDCCGLGFSYPHECHNSLRVTDENLIRKIEEEAGFVRFEVERILNRHLKLHGGMMSGGSDVPALSGNVVGGNFYTARPFGVVDGNDFKHTGYPTKIMTDRINQALKNNDIVLLSTVGTSRLGDLVNVNGNHLAASVAAALQSRKLVTLANDDAVLRRKGSIKTMQEIPLGFSKALLNYYDIKVSKVGFAAFHTAMEKLRDPKAVELLLHIGWSSWALDQGVNRAHIVNPGDGSLLEELFSSKHGVNTCLYHEENAEDLLEDSGDDDFFAAYRSSTF